MVPHRAHFSLVHWKVVAEGTAPGPGVGRTCEWESGEMLEVEVDNWGGRVGAVTLCPLVNRARAEFEGMSFENACSMSRSYTKLSVAGKKGASPGAIVRI